MNKKEEAYKALIRKLSIIGAEPFNEDGITYEKFQYLKRYSIHEEVGEISESIGRDIAYYREQIKKYRDEEKAKLTMDNDTITIYEYIIQGEKNEYDKMDEVAETEEEIFGELLDDCVCGSEFENYGGDYAEDNIVDKNIGNELKAIGREEGIF